ncbi:MAG: hypothetical protein FJY82_14935 [Candidatus Aminicenantes bacterium]|nr:hypothetical protein [Candidatus Aminicenantes bacterium]
MFGLLASEFSRIVVQESKRGQGFAGLYYSADRVARREKAAGASPLPSLEFQRKLEACTAWREDILVFGPRLEPVQKAFAGAGYFHIEIFASLPGKQAELYRQREMESAYQTALGRPEYLIFVRDQGAAWDLFTLDFYRDIKHWADSFHRDTQGAAIR